MLLRRLGQGGWIDGSVLDLISRNGCDAVTNVMGNGQDTIIDGKQICREAIAQYPTFHLLDTAAAICRVRESRVFDGADLMTRRFRQAHR